jgi:hypothetical protein
VDGTDAPIATCEVRQFAKEQSIAQLLELCGKGLCGEQRFRVRAQTRAVVLMFSTNILGERAMLDGSPKGFCGSIQSGPMVHTVAICVHVWSCMPHPRQAFWISCRTLRVQGNASAHACLRIRSRLCHVPDSDPCGCRSPALSIEKMYFLM